MTANFTLHTKGLDGFLALASFLDALVAADEIKSWKRPGWWKISGAEALSIDFESATQAVNAKLRW